MSHHKRSLEAIKRRKDLQLQKQAARKYVYDNEFKDKIRKEQVNLVTKTAIEKKLEKDFCGYLLAAVPEVERGDVLEVPNIYHLELFPECNEFSQ